MKLICTQGELNSSLSLVSRAVPARPTHPVLANVLIHADKKHQRVTVTAFDLSLGIQTAFGAKVLAEGEFTLPAKLFNDIVAKFPEGEITLEVDGDAEASLTSASGRYRVRGMNSEEFPALPTVESEIAVDLPVGSLTAGLRGCLFASSSDETKQILTGAHFTLYPDRLEFAATDGHRLAIVETINNTPLDLEQLELTVPAKSLRELDKMLSMLDPDDMVTLQFEDGQLVCEGGEHRLTSRTLDGQYPNYRQLVPTQYLRQVTCDRKAIISAVERIAVLADQRNNVIRIELDTAEQSLHLAAESADVGSAIEMVPAQITGEDLEIGFNARYLIEGLKSMTSTEVMLQINSALSPATIVPLGEAQMLYLIMPVQIRS